MKASISSLLRGAAVGLALILPGLAVAGPQFVDESGFAVSGYDVVEYWNLDQAEVGQTQPHAVPGKADYTADWNGSKWAFSSAENRDKFQADPAKYAPQFDGHCAYGVSQGGKVWANPHLWRIVDGKLYLNVKDTVVGFWEEDIPGNIVKANGNWSGLEAKPAKTGNAPNFKPTTPES